MHFHRYCWELHPGRARYIDYHLNQNTRQQNFEQNPHHQPSIDISSGIGSLLSILPNASDLPPEHTESLAEAEARRRKKKKRGMRM